MTTPAPESGDPILQREFDEFERGLLPVMRHFLLSFADPLTQAWQHAFWVAMERWGQHQGLIVAHLSYKVIRATRLTHPHGLAFNDPLCTETRRNLTCDELALMRMLHYMRRDDTPEARDAVNQLTGGCPDAHLISAGLTLASRFPANGVQHDMPQRGPSLRVVK